jgi:hypothetical protein
MTKWIIITPQGQPAYGPYSDEETLQIDLDRLREEYGQTEAFTMTLERIGWDDIAFLDNGGNRSQVTREILARLFPTVGTTHTVAEVREALEANPEAVTGSYLTDIRREMGIVSRPHRRRGYSGVQYWTWTREIIPAPTSERETKPKLKRGPKPKNKAKADDNYLALEFIPEEQVWVYADTLDEYVMDPDNFTGYILFADAEWNEWKPAQGIERT